MSRRESPAFPRGMFLLLFAPVLAGCAPWINLKASEAAKVGADHVRLMVVVPERRVFLVERLDRFLWTELVENSYSYESVWDPSPWLEEEIARALNRERGIRATSLRSELDPRAYEALSETAGNAVLKAMSERRGPEYMASPAEDSVRTLRNDRAEYLFQAYLTRILLNRPALARKTITVTLSARIVRLSDGVIVWFREACGTAPVPKLHSFSELEKDNLALLKQCFERAIAALLAPNGPLLRDLGPDPHEENKETSSTNRNAAGLERRRRGSSVPMSADPPADAR